MNNTKYITTTIPYVNAPPHIGHATELVQADAIARFARLRGKSVRFQTGTDENALKNVQSAQALGIPVQQLVEANSARFAELCSALSISEDAFVRTSSDAHHRAVHAFLARLNPDDIYQTEYRGLYCAGCEDFYLARDLVDGRCTDFHAPAVEVAERNYFFRLSRYQHQLRELIVSGRLRITPATREREILQFIDGGLTDISLSRDAERSGGWGIPFPDDTTQVVYVWIDALVNYLTGLGFPDGSAVAEFWQSDGERLHVIGKNVWKFHAVYWPALLLSAGLALPNQILVHGFLTNEGRKISKSTGDAPDPLAYVHAFGADAVRYFLLRHIHPFEDTDFSLRRLEEVYNADLANGLGNLCSRFSALAELVQLNGVGETEAPLLLPEFVEAAEQYRSDLALEVLWREVRQLNQLLSEEKPWVDITAGNASVAREKLSRVATRLNDVAYWLWAYLPETAAGIRSTLIAPSIGKCAALFPRREGVGMKW